MITDISPICHHNSNNDNAWAAELEATFCSKGHSADHFHYGQLRINRPQSGRIEESILRHFDKSLFAALFFDTFLAE